MKVYVVLRYHPFDETADQYVEAVYVSREKAEAHADRITKESRDDWQGVAIESELIG